MVVMGIQKKSSKVKTLWYIVILFLLIFGFQINNINTRYIAFVLSLITLSLEGRGFRKLGRCLRIRTNFYFVIILIFYNILAILIPILHGTFDLSLILESSGVFIILIGVIVYSAVAENYIYTEKHLMTSLFLIFGIQGVIIIFCFLSQTFYEIIRTFQYEQIANVADSYLNSGIARGLALAGDQFFGLSAAFGLIFILLGRYSVCFNNYKTYLLFLFLIIANFFVGRTGFIGVGFAFILVMLVKVKYSKCVFLIKNLLICIVVIYIVYFIFIPIEVKDIVENSVLPFAFELFYNFDKGQGFSSASSDDLLQMLNIPIELSDYVIGSGKFTNADGSYYMYTDSGYMRQIFFGGIGFVIVSVFLFIYLFYISNNTRKKIYTDFNYSIFINVTIVYFLVLQIKGFTIFYSRETMALIFYYLIMMNKINNSNYLKSE